jgi:hypothetical protein
MMKRKTRRRSEGQEWAGGIERRRLWRQRGDREYSTHMEMRSWHPPLAEGRKKK